MPAVVVLFRVLEDFLVWCGHFLPIIVVVISVGVDTTRCTYCAVLGPLTDPVLELVEPVVIVIAILGGRLYVRSYLLTEPWTGQCFVVRRRHCLQTSISKLFVTDFVAAALDRGEVDCVGVVFLGRR